MKSFFEWRQDSFGFLNPYIIAEIGVNHEGDMSLAKHQISLAKDSGAHAVKFQMYKAHLLASKDYSPAYWDLTKENTPSQFQLFQKYDLFTHKDYKELALYCQQIEIDFVCTPFHMEAVDVLEPLVPFFKVASADITNIPLLRKVAKTKKPIMLSVGASQWHEVDSALALLNAEGVSRMALLHCVLNYPTPWEHAQMSLQDELATRYGKTCLIGYSDHVPPLENGDLPALDLSVLRGAVIIEKHFTHDPKLPGNDHYHSCSPRVLQRWVQKLEIFRTLYGNSKERNMSWEISAIKNARRRIHLAVYKEAGSILQEGDIVALRANTGIEIGEYDRIIGKTLKNSKKKDEQLNFDDIF